MTTDHPPRWNGDRYGAHRPRPATTPTAADRAEMADLELVARLNTRAAAGRALIEGDRWAFWRLAADYAALAVHPMPTVADLDDLAQRALALAVDAEHRSRKQ